MCYEQEDREIRVYLGSLAELQDSCRCCLLARFRWLRLGLIGIVSSADYRTDWIL